MMRVRFTSERDGRAEGEVVDYDETSAQYLIDEKVAELVEPEPAAEQPVETDSAPDPVAPDAPVPEVPATSPATTAVTTAEPLPVDPPATS